jgi:hypothetical protein
MSIDPKRENVKWHGDSLQRCAVYRFNTKLKDQLFCPNCGTSIGIDFRDFFKPKFDGYGISVSCFTFVLCLSVLCSRYGYFKLGEQP